MMTLFEQWTSVAALREAAQRAARGKRERPDCAAFLFHLESRVLALHRALQAGTWQPGPYRSVVVHEPKRRHISIAPFADRVVHQAFHGLFGPLSVPRFIADSFASIPGRGQHRAIARYEHFRERYAWVLRTDIYRFFPSIDHAVAKACAQRFVPCAASREVLARIIDGSNLQEPVDLFFPGDDLLSPLARRRGLPLGNLSSQWLGNVVLDRVDHVVKDDWAVKGYVRYLDDMALFTHSREEALALQARLLPVLDALRLRLHPRKTVVQPSATPTPFLGLVLHPGGHRRLPAANVGRAAQRLADLRRAWRSGQLGEDEVRLALNGWQAHARHADTWQLRQRWLGGGWCGPAAEALRARP
ncbi:MAG: RNA-directed DNA polymerase [Ideonella sp.]|nr:RNA-directed DNA polymerase [Ideonella sp.]